MEAVIRKGPNGVFSRRTAAEILTRNQNAGTSVLRLIQCKVGIRFAGRGATPVVEQEFSEPGPFYALEELFGNDLIGINVRPIHAGNQAGVSGEGVHRKMSKVENQMSKE